MAPLALQLRKKYNIPVGLRLHNIEWTIWQRYADVLNPYHPKRLYIQSQAKKLKKNEKEILDQVDIAFAITEEDKRRAMELSPDLNVVVASAGVNLSEWVVDRSTKRNRQELILATTYQWQHNIDAVKWFIENVLTKLHTLYPDIKLTLLGKNAPNWLADYKNIGVNLVGYVEKVQPYLNQAGIYVSPLFVGGGIRIKILEAMAMELPVLATNIAAEGIKCKNGDGLIICNSAEDYIRHVSKLIEDPDYSKSLVSNSVAFISENYSWKQNVEKMILEYRQLQKRYRNISKNDYFVK